MTLNELIAAMQGAWYEPVTGSAACCWRSLDAGRMRIPGAGFLHWSPGSICWRSFSGWVIMPSSIFRPEFCTGLRLFRPFTAPAAWRGERLASAGRSGVSGEAC